MQHNPANVTLSKHELELVTNAQILLTKNEIIKKVYSLFGDTAGYFAAEAKGLLPAEIALIAPKISRGENYEGLPYVMLDYPRYFKKENTFAIRTFFWWGNFISITLQLSGEYKNAYSPALQKAISIGSFQNWYIAAGESEWHHHFRNDNYTLITSQTLVSDKAFIKLATKIPLSEWDHVQLFLQQNFSLLIKALQS